MEHHTHVFKSLRESVNEQIARKRSELNRAAQLGVETVPEADIGFFFQNLAAEVKARLKPDEHALALETESREAKAGTKSLQTEADSLREEIRQHRHKENIFNSQGGYDWQGSWKVDVAKGALGLAEGVNVYFAFQALFPLWPVAVAITLCFPVIFVITTSAIAKGVRLCPNWFAKGMAILISVAAAAAMFYALAVLREIVMVDSGGMVIPEWLSVIVSVFFFSASIFVNLIYNPTDADIKLRQDAQREAKVADKLERRVKELHAEVQKADKAALAGIEEHRRYLDEAAAYEAYLENARKEMAQSYRNELALFRPNRQPLPSQNNIHTKTQLT